MDQQQPLDELPGQLANLVKAVATASTTVVNTSVERQAWPSAGPEIYSIARAAMNWRLFFSIKTTNVVFFFFRSETDFIPVDARVSAFLSPAAEMTVTSRPISALELVFPVFVVTGLSPEDFALFTPPGATEQDTLVLALNPQQTTLLAISFRKVPRVRCSENRVPGKVEEGKYSLGPLLRAIDVIRDLSNTAWPLGAPVKRSNVANATIAAILDKLEQAYAEVSSVLSKVSPAMVGTVDLSCRRLSGYGSDLTVGLKEDGSLATKADNERYRVNLRFAIADQGNTAPQLFPQLPAMQVQEKLYTSFFETLLGDGLLTMAHLLGINDSNAEVRKLLARQFLESARKDASILLMERHPGFRKYLVLLRGELFGRGATTAVCSMELAQSSEDSVFWFQDGDQEVIALFQGKGDQLVIGKDEANLLFPLFAAIKRWKDLL